MKELQDSVKTDKKFILSLIKYEVLQEAHIFRAFKTFCRALGEDVMEFKEFEFWFMRFSNGLVDMDYDRSIEPKPLELADLPLEMLCAVVDKLDPVTRLLTRHVSKSLRNAVDQTKVKFERLEVRVKTGIHNLVQFDLDKDYIIHNIRNDKTEEVLYDIVLKKLETGGIMKAAANNWKEIIKNQDLEMKEMKLDLISNNPEEWKELFDAIKESSGSGYAVESLIISKDLSRVAASILSTMKPGVLENIEIATSCPIGDISQLEQWKQAKKVKYSFDPPDRDWLIFQHFAHFEEFSVKGKSMLMFLHDIPTMKSFLASPTFRKGILDSHSSFGIPQIALHLDTEVRFDNTVRFVDPEFPESCLEFSSQRKSLIIEKKAVL